MTSRLKLVAAKDIRKPAGKGKAEAAGKGKVESAGKGEGKAKGEADPEKMKEGDLVQVCCEICPEKRAGQYAFVESQDAAGAKLLFPDDGVIVKMKWGQFEARSKEITNRAVKRRAFGRQLFPLAIWRARDYIMFPSRELLRPHVLMDNGSMDALCTEACWRVGPGRCTTLPSVMVTTLLPCEREDELKVQRTIALKYIAVSDLIFVPILWRAHWTS